MSKILPEQESYIREQAAAGATLNSIQNGLREKFDLGLTYMNARLLLIDLGVTLDEDKEPEPEPQPEPTDPAADPNASADADAEEGFDDYADDIPPPGPGGSKLSLTVDVLTRPGAAASGKVTFSDGKSGAWYIDNSGRLGIVPPEPGYQPSETDIPEFQRQLALEMRKMGY